MQRAIMGIRLTVAAVTILFGGLLAGIAVAGYLGGERRLGVLVYMPVQGCLYVAAGLALATMRGRLLAEMLFGLILVQVVHTTAVNPPAPLFGALSGILLGGAAPTLLLAAAAALLWRWSDKPRVSSSGT